MLYFSVIWFGSYLSLVFTVLKRKDFASSIIKGDDNTPQGQQKPEG